MGATPALPYTNQVTEVVDAQGGRGGTQRLLHVGQCGDVHAVALAAADLAASPKGVTLGLAQAAVLSQIPGELAGDLDPHGLRLVVDCCQWRFGRRRASGSATAVRTATRLTVLAGGLLLP